MTDQSTRLPVRRALISVSDKTGVIEFARELVALGVEILSTGGTFKLLRENEIAAVEVADYTGFPEEVTAAAQICAPMRIRCRCGPRCRKRPTQSTRRSSRRSISRRA